MTTPDPTLAARLARLLAGEHEIEAESGCPDYEDLDQACGNAYRSNQLITTAEADARVKAAVLAEHNRCVDAIKNARARNTKIGSVEWTLACEMIAAIRSRGVTG